MKNTKASKLPDEMAMATTEAEPLAEDGFRAELPDDDVSKDEQFRIETFPWKRQVYEDQYSEMPYERPVGESDSFASTAFEKRRRI